MKKFLAISALGLAACIAATAGCSSKLKNYASLASNWYTYPDNKKIQPAFTEKSEKLYYSVEQTQASDNGVYSVEYAEGTYTTDFTAVIIDSEKLNEITKEEWRGDYAAMMGGAVDEDGKFMVLYRYITELKIPKVTYTFGESVKEFENEYRRTESYFMSVEDYLSPVYTKTEIKSSSPAETKPQEPTTIDDCYLQVDRIYQSFYTSSASDVQTDIYDRSLDSALPSVNVSKLNSVDYSVFDTAYLDIVVRAMKGMSAGSGQTVTLFTPNMKAAKYVISGSDAPISDNEELCRAQLGSIREVLREKSLLAEEDEETLSTVAMNVIYDNGVHSGTSQRYWFANASDKKGKRTIMIKYSCPLAYNSGRLEYVLRNIESIPDV